MPRAIDHLVLALPDLGAGIDLYRRLGFTVGSRNRHPWGTENAVVQLDGAYLELIGLAAGFVAPPEGDPAAPFARPVAEAVARGGGLAMVALTSQDADADAEMVRSSGFGRGSRLDFGRTAEAPDGTRRAVRFSLAFVEELALGEADLFTCQQHRPGLVRDPAARRHHNGALRLDAVVLAARHPGPTRGTAGDAAGNAGHRPRRPPRFRDRDGAHRRHGAGRCRAALRRRRRAGAASPPSG